MKKIFPGSLIQYNDCNIFYIVINTTEQYMSVIRLEISNNFDTSVSYIGYSIAMSYVNILK